MLLLIPLRAVGLWAPFRVSSYGKGKLARPATFTIAIDMVTVEGNQGNIFRAAWVARYEATVPSRRLPAQLGMLWGIGGIFVAARVITVIVAVPNESVGRAVDGSS